MTQHKPMQLEIFEHTAKAKREAKPQGEIPEKISEINFPTQLCMKSACLLILIIVSFALGVERGKAISKSKPSPRFLAETQTAPVEIKEITVKDEAPAPIAIPENKKLEKQKKADTIQTSGYIIQVASYKRDSSYIEREIAKLRKDGYKTITVSSSGGEYMGVCAGEFINKQEAQKHLKQLQRRYKDCFIRKI